jgi:large subunit ribosomal protein L17
MRHQKTRHKLSRSTAHRKALLANLCKEVIEHERIKTSEAKAKAVKPEIEKLITLAKRGDLHARRQALATLGQDKFAVYKLFDEVAPRYVERNGGYTRILKLGPRRSDSTEMVFLELVEGFGGAARHRLVAASAAAERLIKCGRSGDGAGGGSAPAAPRWRRLQFLSRPTAHPGRTVRGRARTAGDSPSAVSNSRIAVVIDHA